MCVMATVDYSRAIVSGYENVTVAQGTNGCRLRSTRPQAESHLHFFGAKVSFPPGGRDLGMILHQAGGCLWKPRNFRNGNRS
jgi:hypothetical protein